MLDSPLVEIGLGLAFVFTLFSLLVSAANEIIVALFKSRAVSLWDGIGMLLNGNDALRKAFFAHPLIGAADHHILRHVRSQGSCLTFSRSHTRLLAQSKQSWCAPSPNCEPVIRVG